MISVFTNYIIIVHQKQTYYEKVNHLEQIYTNIDDVNH